METSRRKMITVVTPVYNEEETVRTCHAEVKKVMETLADRYDYEHIFGDNRSRDRTLEILEGIALEDPHVKVLSYSRNFGFERSSSTLLRHASGDAVVGMTADLQEPPSLIPSMVELWERGNDVVYGVYRSRGEGLTMRATRKVYYWLVDKLSPERLPHGFTGFSLLDRRVLDEVNAVDDHAPYLRGIIATVGFKQVALEFERSPRVAGRSKNGISTLFDFGINGIISYSIVPIRLATIIGILLSAGSFITAVGYAILKMLLWEVQAPGAATIIVLVLFFSGVQLVFLGILGEYVGAIHSQVRRKPFVIVDRWINFTDEDRRRFSYWATPSARLPQPSDKGEPR